MNWPRSAAWLKGILRFTRSSRVVPRRPARYRPRLESLEDRLAPAITASYSAGVISVDMFSVSDTATLTGTTTTGNTIQVAGTGFTTTTFGPATGTPVTQIVVQGHEPGQTVTLNDNGGGTEIALSRAISLNSVPNLVVSTSSTLTCSNFTDIPFIPSGSLSLGSSITTTSGQLLAGAVTLTANSTLTDTGTVGINISNTVDGGFNFNVGSGGPIALQSPIGSNTPLASLTTGGGGSTQIGGGSISTSGDQSYNETLVVTGNNSFTSTKGGDITFGGTIQETAGPPDAVTVNSSGTIAFNGAIGGNGNAFTTLTTGGGGTTAINTTSVTTTGDQNYNENVTLGANVTLNTHAPGGVTFAGALDSPGTQYNLVINSAGNVNFNGPVGKTSPLAVLNTNANTVAINGGFVNTSGFSQNYNDAVITLGSPSTQLFGGPVVMGQNLILGTSATTATSSLQVGGNLFFSPSETTLTTTIAGPTQVGHISVGGFTAFNTSMFALNYANGFVPSAGQSFDIVSNGFNSVGEFSNVPAPGPVTLGGVTYAVTYFGSAGGSDFILTVAQPPAITSGGSVAFFEGQSFTTMITTTGNPNPKLTETGNLPSGVTFVDNGNGTATLSGTPAANAAGVYPLVITANNGATPNAVQNFTLTVTYTALATGTDAGGAPVVNVYDSKTDTLKFSFLAYSPAFLGGVRVAVCSNTATGVPYIITAPGPGISADIRVYDGSTGQLLVHFPAFDSAFTGGSYVAVGDVNGDGADEIIVGADAGGGPVVKVFSGSGSLLQTFFAFDPSFTGGVRVAGGNVGGGSVAEILCAAGPGGGPVINVFSGSGTLLSSIVAFPSTFTGGVYVAAADLNGDGHADIIAGVGAGGGPLVNVFSGLDDSVLLSFMAYDPSFLGGVRVAAAVGSDGHTEIVTGTGPGGSPLVRTFNGGTGAQVDQFFAYDPTFTGGIYVG